jgi:hypothetical protein
LAADLDKRAQYEDHRMKEEEGDKIVPFSPFFPYLPTLPANFR